MLERFGFTGDRLTARIGDLSGGERRRFQMLRLLLSEPNVLLLDEPTNDLDIETLTVLEDFLDGWPGTLVVVSHDRYFLERVTDSTWALLGDGQVSMLPRGVEEYLERRAAAARRRRRRPRGDAAAGRARASAGPRHRREQREARKAVARLDKQLARLAEREAGAARRDGRARQPTTSGSPRSTYGCARWPPRRTPSRSSGSRPPPSSTDRLTQRPAGPTSSSRAS